MVEGPGCTLNGEKIRARVLPGQAVISVRGRARQSFVGPESSPAASLAGVSFPVSQSEPVWSLQRERRLRGSVASLSTLVNVA